MLVTRAVLRFVRLKLQLVLLWAGVWVAGFAPLLWGDK